MKKKTKTELSSCIVGLARRRECSAVDMRRSVANVLLTIIVNQCWPALMRGRPARFRRTLTCDTDDFLIAERHFRARAYMNTPRREQPAPRASLCAMPSSIRR